MSCEWGSWRPAFKPLRICAISGSEAARLMSRGSWSRASANQIFWHIWNRICGIAAMLTFRTLVHKGLCAPFKHEQHMVAVCSSLRFIIRRPTSALYCPFSARWRQSSTVKILRKFSEPLANSKTAKPTGASVFFTHVCFGNNYDNW